MTLCAALSNLLCWHYLGHHWWNLSAMVICLFYFGFELGERYGRKIGKLEGYIERAEEDIDEKFDTLVKMKLTGVIGKKTDS
jgi:hypothetical protein